jgi:hypothetical protein
VLNGQIGDALPFYDIAKTKAATMPNDVTVTVLREQGYALFLGSPYQDTKKARASYIEALQILDGNTTQGSFVTYSRYLSELGAFEMDSGDWKCGKPAMTEALYLFGMMSNVDQSDCVKDTYRMAFEVNQRNTTKRPDQPEIGCDYPNARTPRLIVETAGRFGFTTPKPPPLNSTPVVPPRN